MNLDNIKIPQVFRDILIASVGMTLLLVANILYGYELDKITNFDLIENNSVLAILLIFILSYFIGRILLIIEDLWSSIITVFFNFFSKSKRKDNFKYWKNLMLYNFGNKSIMKLDPLSGFSQEDLYACLIKNKILLDEFSRHVYHNFFIRLVLGESLVLFFLLHNWCLFITVIVLSLKLFVDRYDNGLRNRRIIDKKDILTGQ